LKLKITKEKTLYKISDVGKINLEDRMFFPIYIQAPEKDK
jgi:hypothetical protein